VNILICLQDWMKHILTNCLAIAPCESCKPNIHTKLFDKDMLILAQLLLLLLIKIND